MGTDTFIVHRGPCRCGEGAFEYGFSEPDHGWPTASRRSFLTIECRACAEKYALIVQEQHVVLVDGQAALQRHEDRERREREWREGTDGVLEHDDVKDLVARLIIHVSDCSSMAATARELRRVLPHEVGSDSTFRKHVRVDRGVKNWVAKRLRAYHLSSLVDFVGTESPELKALATEVERLWRQRCERPQRLTPIGEPICKAIPEEWGA